ncbi:MAG: acyl-CoA reductase [Euryarchaeota archaeon]|nr:acyl-CoA reductase [Euryarchaeota archaeon]
MIDCHLLNGEFKRNCFTDFCDISKIIDENRLYLYEYPLDAIIDLLNTLGKKILINDSINRYQGISYISLWLRKENLLKLCRLNYNNPDYLDKFTALDKKLEMCAQPRGIVCHWIAGNMPTLAVYSAVQAILSKNGSIIKVPVKYKDIILELLCELNRIEITRDGRTYSGKVIVNSISVVSFDGKDQDISKHFSMAADCRLTYGGSTAIQAIRALPTKDHCETIVYGPKYSFGVFDRKYIESNLFEDALKKSVLDIALFNQMACSSPHVFFFEKSRYSLKEIALMIKTQFEVLPDELRYQEKPPWMAANTINIRGYYLLDNETDIVQSDGLNWTILINNKTALEEPISGKCIYIKEIDRTEEILPLITRKIQAMMVCISDPQRRRNFARDATYYGVDRIVTPGRIHDYDLPWDGILPLNRLVRWVILKWDGEMYA